ncbi:MAG TPA: hypothetical protein PLU10_02885 [Chitinophagaceae bacterium]|nr:hypothetical protein [Chitinophagaceae bacterium]
MFLLSIPLIISAFVFAKIQSSKDVCQGVDIRMTNPEFSFVSKDDVVAILKEHHIQPQSTRVKAIQIPELENAILENKWIASTNMFVSANSVLHVLVEQREPKVRILQKDSSDYSYYLDQYANAIEWSEKYTPRLPVVTAPTLGYTRADLNLKSDLVMLANFIAKDSFWNVAISQIDIHEGNQIRLIPAIGTQVILLGDISDLENKMARLFAFYQQGINTISWDKYDEIDVRFQGQVVCRNTRGEKLSEDPYGVEEQMEMKKADYLAAINKPTATKPSAKHTAKPNVKPNTKKATSVPVKAKPSPSKTKETSQHKPTTKKTH